MFVRHSSLALLTAGALAIVFPGAHAQNAANALSESPQSYALAAGDLGTVLHRIVSGSGLALAIPAGLIEGRSSQGVQGRYSPREALGQALAGTGLAVVTTPSGALTLAPVAVPSSQGAPQRTPQLAPVIVTAAPVSADTQGSGSYGAAFMSMGKGLATLRETPYSVSVVTRQQLDDQNAASLGDAMSYVTGIRVLSTSTGVVNLRSRGFRLNNYLLDGVPLRGGQGMWGSALMDVALYDRIEVWRGPAGLLEGAGEPSGTLNLARKRAHGEPSLQAAGMAGSWNKLRTELDLNRPLNEAGSLRGRVVAVHDQRDSFVDEVMQRSNTVYGTLEYDFSPSTTVSVGHTAQRGRSVAFAGLPLIAGGQSPDYARSTFLGSRNGIKQDRGRSSFAELEHRTDAGGVWRTHLNEYVTRNTLDRFIANSMVDPVTRQFDLEGAWQKSLQVNRGFDSFYTQPFVLGGQSHEFTVGASHQIFKGGQIQRRHAIWRQNVDAPQHDLSLPETDLGEVPQPRARDRGLYGSVRLHPVDRLTVLAGGRLAWWDSRDPGQPGERQSISSRFVPNLGVIHDFHPQWSVYGSYNRIFSPQTERQASGAYLAPRTGEQYEVGVKGELFDQRVNTHLAVFRIEDNGRAIDDLENDDFSVAAGHVRSQGIEAEISGQITPGWNLIAGYAYTHTVHRNGAVADVGQPFDSTFPRHQFSLWTRYQLPAALLRGAFVGGGVRSSSKTYADYSGSRWTQGGFSVFALQAGYSWAPGWSASLTLNNVFDKKYFERFAGGSARQTYYGEPANATLTVRAQF